MLLLGLTFYRIFLSSWQLLLNAAVTRVPVSLCIIPYLPLEKHPSPCN